MTAILWQQGDTSPARARRQSAASLLSLQAPFSVTEKLLAEGGDARILLDPDTGLNKYGCPTTPDPRILAFGSSTASIISAPGFAAAGRLRQKIAIAARHEHPSQIYARELDRIRATLLRLCGLTVRDETEVLFAASGTDLHLLAAKITGGSENKPSLAIMVEASETGSGVGAALGGCHFSHRTALGEDVTEGSKLGGVTTNDVVNVALRKADGSPRPAVVIDAEVEALVTCAAAQGQTVLLTMVDVSKTGFMAPSLACVLELQRRFPATLSILVDACQFRLAPATLRAYLAQGFMVMVTGSKFMTGPTFCGALLIPRQAAEKFRGRSLNIGLQAYSAHSDWPLGWPAAKALDHVANFGLLLRWEAALAEFSAFSTLPEDKIAGFLEKFAVAVNARLQGDELFEPVAVPKLDREALIKGPSWDQLQTIFPFRLYHPQTTPERLPLSLEETSRIYRMLQVDEPRCQLGQPVACGTVAGRAVSALRICLSARLIGEALADEGRGADSVIRGGLAALDKTADLVRGL